MTRFLLLLLFASPAAASVVPPVPRIVIPVDAFPKPDAPPADESDPAAIADRVAKSAKELGDKLAANDTGADTLTGQDKLKRDMDALIKALDNQPPMGGGGGGSSSGSPPPPMGGGGGAGGSSKPMGGGSSSGRSRKQERSRSGSQPMPEPGQKEPQPGGGKPMPMPGSAQPMPMPGAAGAKPMPAGAIPNGGGTGTPALPLDEAIARDFWGNLPELPRQRMMQFFREQYLSRYKDLLPQYYQSLAEKDRKGKK